MDEYAEMKHTYFARLQHLRDELEDVEKRDATIRAEQERNFPESVDEFNDLPTEAQQRVAKYLVADKAGQEMMKAKFGWAWRQTVPLLNAFKSNVSNNFLHLHLGGLIAWYIFRMSSKSAYSR